MVKLVSQDQVMACLEEVHDPHVPVSLRKMGMLQNVTVHSDGRVHVDVTVPCLGCPAVELLQTQIQNAISKLEAVTQVTVNAQWGADWQRQDIDPCAHPLLRQYGLQL